MLRIYRRLFSVALLSFAGACEAARSQEYPFDIAKRDPAAMRSWRAIIPKELRRQSWIMNFDGVAGPIDTVTLHDRVFYYGEVCIPHDCAGNFVAFLIPKGGGEALGALASEAIGVRHRYFGAPDAEARQLLDKELANNAR
jgi:hypothetical protein